VEIVILIGCVVLALNLALWAALFSKLNELPRSLGHLAERHDAEGERRGLTALQEAVASRVGMIVRALRNYEEQVAAGYRTQVADAEIRARLAERQASEAGVALEAASVLVRELRQVLDVESRGARAPSRSAPTLPEGRETVAMEPADIDTARKPGNPEPASRERPSPRIGLASGVAPAPHDEDARLSEDEMTQVASRPLPGLLDAGKTLVSPGEKESAR
jgi:hypothetical protein